MPFIAVRAAAPPPTTTAKNCLMFAANNIAKGGGNFFVYTQFSDKRIDLRSGDALEYDVYLNPSNPVPGGGIDFDTDRGSLRDSGSFDQNHLRAHGDAKLELAVGKWYHRRIALDKLTGQRVRRWNVVFEGDKPGTYGQFIDNVAI